MKLRFHPSLNELNLTKLNPRKRLRLKGRGMPRVIRCKALSRNYSADSFGVFDGEIKHSKIKAFGKNIVDFFRNMLSRIREKRRSCVHRSRISPITLLGTLCGALSVAIICALAVVLSLFVGRTGSYTVVSIPSFISLSEAEATSYQTDLFEYTVIYKSNPDFEAGAVTAQSPIEDVTRKLYENGEKIKITLTVNSPQATLTLPHIVGKSLRDTVILLKSADIGVNVINEYSSSVPFGQIIYSSAPEGSVLKKGDFITLRASLGKQVIYSSVPNLLGLNEYQATERLNNCNLEVGDISYRASKQPIGTIIEQSVESGTELKEKSKISFTLSGGIYYQS